MDIVSAAFALAYISAASPLIPFILGAIHYRTFSSYLKVLFIYICVACSIELLNFYLFFQGVYNNLYTGQICTVIEFCAFIYMYCVILKITPAKLVFAVFSVFFSLLVVLDVIYIEGYFKVHTIPRNAEAIVLIIFSIVYFYKLMVQAAHTNLLALPAFWINAGVLIYCSGNFFLILFMNYLIEEDRIGSQVFYMIHSVFNITFNLLIGIGFLKQRNAY